MGDWSYGPVAVEVHANIHSARSGSRAKTGQNFIFENYWRPNSRTPYQNKPLVI